MTPSPTPAASSAPRSLILLGCGYLGAALAKSSLAAGWRVSALTRNRDRAAELRALGLAAVIVADLADDSWHASLDPANAAIVNTVSPSARESSGYEHSFIAGTRSIIRWLEKSVAASHAPARDLLFTSATSVYPHTDGRWVDESTPLDPSALSPAASALRSGEDFFLNLPATLARRAWVLRLGGIYGPGRHYLLDALRSGQRIFPGRGDFWVNLIHRDDILAAIRLALAAPENLPGGLFNAVDDTPVLKQDLLAGLAHLLQIDPATVRCDPATPSDRARRRENLHGITPNRRVANLRLKQLEWSLSYPSFEAGFRECLTHA